MPQLASWCGIKYKTLKKIPDSAGVQRPLQLLVDAWKILSSLLADEPAVHRWLNHPVRSLDGRTPLSILERTDADVDTITNFHEFVKSLDVEISID